MTNQLYHVAGKNYTQNELAKLPNCKFTNGTWKKIHTRLQIDALINGLDQINPFGDNTILTHLDGQVYYKIEYPGSTIADWQPLGCYL